ncbi:unnamed protein product [Darwinula stevensoni]|uniref:Chitinase n=1 Tax=Darwinula stevensoni TaxID=69355 RepID=A0A7R9FRE0_9CRUS|nr:unnamed protein product [Darwinula stevensoni]CAG0901488.1 unnamed protein product [Darwinula stevensoni]
MEQGERNAYLRFLVASETARLAECRVRPGYPPKRLPFQETDPRGKSPKAPPSPRKRPKLRRSETKFQDGTGDLPVEDLRHRHALRGLVDDLERAHPDPPVGVWRPCRGEPDPGRSPVDHRLYGAWYSLGPIRSAARLQGAMEASPAPTNSKLAWGDHLSRKNEKEKKQVSSCSKKTPYGALSEKLRDRAKIPTKRSLKRVARPNSTVSSDRTSTAPSSAASATGPSLVVSHEVSRASESLAGQLLSIITSDMQNRNSDCPSTPPDKSHPRHNDLSDEKENSKLLLSPVKGMKLRLKQMTLSPCKKSSVDNLVSQVPMRRNLKEWFTHLDGDCKPDSPETGTQEEEPSFFSDNPEEAEEIPQDSEFQSEAADMEGSSSTDLDSEWESSGTESEDLHDFADRDDDSALSDYNTQESDVEGELGEKGFGERLDVLSGDSGIPSSKRPLEDSQMADSGVAEKIQPPAKRAKSSRNPNENYISLNMKQKKFSRGKKKVNVRNMKYKQWKQRVKQQNTESGTTSASEATAENDPKEPKTKLSALEERMKNSTCFSCSKKGHWASNCPNKGNSDFGQVNDSGKQTDPKGAWNQRVHHLRRHYYYKRHAQDADKKVVCYWGSWSIYREGNAHFGLTELREELCTHVIYAFLGIDQETLLLTHLDPNVDLNPCESVNGKDTIRSLMALRENHPEVKMMLGIGGWNEGSSKWSDMVATPTTRSKFIYSVLRALATFDADGVDLDWEYPGLRGGRPSDKLNYVTLVGELRNALNKYGESFPTGRDPPVLSISVPGTEELLANFELAQMHGNVDFMNVMAYDYYMCTPDSNCYVGPQSALKPSDDMNPNYNVESTIGFIRGKNVPAEKLVLGIPLSARTYVSSTFPPDPEEWFFPADAPGPAGPYCQEEGILCYIECPPSKRSTFEAIRSVFQPVA